jgi:hexosaminidase
MKNLSNRVFLLVLLSLFSTSIMQASNYNIIPIPTILIPQKGTFTFNKNTRVLCDRNHPKIMKLAQQFANQFELVSGMKLSLKEISGADTTNSIIFQSISETNKEAYNLSVTSKTIRIQSQTANGFFYGLQTLYQLLPPEIYGKQLQKSIKWLVSCVLIIDEPRFAYRGLHLDVCRHFFPVSFIKKYIDAMAVHKLNTFHWHLTDDQGWRIEIKKYPKLTEIGSKRDETMIGNGYQYFPKKFDNTPYGGFYTQDEAREIVAYAAERFITIIPEIEMPGHAQAAVASYPYLGCNPDSTVKVATSWGIFTNVFCPRDTTFRFLEDVLTEIMAIFPSKYIHIGGDECPKDQWKTNAECQAMIKNLNLKDENGLQSYFVHRIEEFLNAHGRSVIGWDEILDGGIAPNATIMSWRGTLGGIAAAKAGHDVIMTPNAYCYLDHYQSDPQTEPLAIGGFLPLQMVYQFEPVPAELTSDEEKFVLGAQANVWTEYIPDSKQVEYMVFPRLAAMSEVLWSAKQNRNWDDFRSRMKTQFQRYNNLKLNYSEAFQEVQVRSNITTDRKIQVSLTCDNPDAEIHYSIKDKSEVYKNPITLSESTDITATVFEKGKPVGKTVSKSFHVSKLTGLNCVKNFNNTWYNGGNTNALTDGVYGNSKSYAQWTGFRKGGDAEVVVDLLKVQPIHAFSVGILHAPALCALISPTVKLYGSLDGINYNLLADKALTIPTVPNWVIERPELTFAETNVKFLKLVLPNPGDCPADPPTIKNGGVIFLDEIEAW